MGSEYQPFGDIIGELSKNLGFRSGPPGSQPPAQASAPGLSGGPRRSGSSGGAAAGRAGLGFRIQGISGFRVVGWG